MQCSICKEKPATVHLTQIVGEKMQKLDLCEDCAKTKGVNDPSGFAGWRTSCSASARRRKSSRRSARI
jgi:protein-arginine kinase activator protein McsA